MSGPTQNLGRTFIGYKQNRQTKQTDGRILFTDVRRE